WPPLTTIRQPVAELAAASADLLLGGTPDAEQVTLDYELKVRGTTGPAASN
ncbi:MAG: LacI family transcriptional regulator, partial [Sphingomonadales bacterium]